MKRLILGALLLTASAPLAAHGAEHAAPATAPWTFDPILTVPLALVLLVYLRGLWRLWGRSQRGRATRRAQLHAAHGRA